MAGGIGGLPLFGPGDARSQRQVEERFAMEHPSGRPVPPQRRQLALRELPAAERPRERLAIRGPGGLSAAELVALVWGSGSRGMNAVDLAGVLLSRFEGITGLSRASATELQEAAGVGPARAAQIEAAFELGRRLLADWPAGRWQIRSPRDVADRLVLQMGRLER
jgi:DNA repair protein RadC